MQYCRWGLMRVEQRGKIPSLHLLATLLWMQPRTRLAFWAAGAHGRLMSNLSSTRIPESVLILGRALSPVQDLALGLVELQEVCCTTRLGVPCRLAEGALSPTVCVSGCMNMKIFNSIGPSTDPGGTPLGTGFRLEPLTIPLWTGPSSQFLIRLTVHPSNPYLSNLEARMLGETVSKAVQKSR